MSSQKTQIGNMALIRLGVSKIVANVDTESSTEARLIRTVFDDERDDVLRDFPWPFARKIADLGLVGGTEDEAVNSDWQYSYQYPADCIYARRLVTVAGRNNTTPPPFVIGSDDSSGQLIFTDESDAQLEYTRRVSEPDLFDPIFRSALSWKIAMSIAGPLSRIKEAVQLAFKGFAFDIARAQARAMNESQQDDPAESEFVRSRE